MAHQLCLDFKRVAKSNQTLFFSTVLHEQKKAGPKSFRNFLQNEISFLINFEINQVINGKIIIALDNQFRQPGTPTAIIGSWKGSQKFRWSTALQGLT